MKKILYPLGLMSAVVGGSLLIGCGESNFQAKDFSITNLTTTYNGQAQMFELDAPAGTTITYSLDGKT